MNLFQAALIQMEKENEELIYKTTQGSDELSALREENEQMRLNHAKLEKDFLKLKREVSTFSFLEFSLISHSLICKNQDK